MPTIKSFPVTNYFYVFFENKPLKLHTHTHQTPWHRSSGLDQMSEVKNCSKEQRLLCYMFFSY